jgi:hypothetical protein
VPVKFAEKPDKPEIDGKALNNLDILSTVGVDKTHGTEVFEVFLVETPGTEISWIS